ncbi:uncharacterized protein LOC126966897 [Leptidea sinapis]|uniref:uncharacterized protein LOC126966897 n=1 Tax=Leptidea sinapis TaxID=189913 RepID=UPI0021C3C5B2|nr:uncharacterized protein LOC126966897 [Leptidea sinapis]
MMLSIILLTRFLNNCSSRASVANLQSSWEMKRNIDVGTEVKNAMTLQTSSIINDIIHLYIYIYTNELPIQRYSECSETAFDSKWKENTHTNTFGTHIYHFTAAHL